MIKRLLKITLLFLLSPHQNAFCQDAPASVEDHELRWEKLASFTSKDIPLENLNGFFAGSHNGAVLIAGGAKQSPADSIQNAGIQWNDEIFVFVQNEKGAFEKIEKKFKLPFSPFAVATAIPTNYGLVCVGSTSASEEKLAAFIITWNSEFQIVEFDTLPFFEKPGRLLSGTLLGTKIYLAGGFGDQNDLLSIDLANPASKQSQVIKQMDGPSGFSPVIVSQSDGLDNCLYFFGKTDVLSGNVLNESFQFNPKTNHWKKLNPFPFDLGKPAELLFHPALAIGSTDILYFDQPSRSVYLYHTITDNWNKAGTFPAGVIPICFFKNGNKILALAGDTTSEVPQSNLYSISFTSENQKYGFLNVLVLVLYFVALIYMGFYFSKKQKNTDDYFKGGKKIPWWAAGLSLYGTGLSAISYMAVPAKTYATDWAYFMSKLPQILIPVVVCWLFIPFYKRLDITSAYEYLEKRFNLATRLIGSLSFIIFQIGRIGIVLYLPAIALNVATGMDIILCIILMGVISLVYTFMGGIEAVVWSDVFQVIVLIGGIILCLVLIAVNMEGGLKGVIEVGRQHEKFEILNMTLDFTQPTFWVVVLSGFFSQLIVYSTDQSMVQKYLTTKDLQSAKRSIWISTLVSLSIGWIFFFVGTALFAFYKKHPEELMPAMQSTDSIFPWYIFSQLPDGVSGLLIAGIFAAAMSTLSSCMNSAATAYTVDFHQLFRWKGNALFVGRVSTLFVGIVGISFALMFATMNIKSIWDEFIKIIGLITGGLGGVFLLGIISSRANGTGALVGLFCSGIIQFLVAQHQPVHFLLFTATGFISCLIIGYVVSLLFPDNSKSLTGLTIYSVKRKNPDIQ